MGARTLPALRLLAVFFAGSVFPLGLAPFDFWPATVISAGLFAGLLHWLPQSGFFIGWLYGAGFFLTGSSWVYVSIHVYGHAPAPLAAVLTAGFCLGLALLTGLQGALYRRLFQPRGWIAATIAFPALWVLFEWLRSWLLTGFPWLFAGYASLHSVAAGWAPVWGIFGQSLLVVALGSGAVAITLAPAQERTKAAGCITLLLLIAGAGHWLNAVEWTQASGQPIRAALYQPNISLEKKWDRRYFNDILNQHQRISESLYSQFDIVLWPESALPAVKDRIEPYLDRVAQSAQEFDSTLITGIPVRAESGLHNSIIALGAGRGVHHKQKLVPFGEYVPLEQWLRGLIAFFDLPMSSFVPGPQQRPLLHAGNIPIAPFICYEVVYPDFVFDAAGDAELLLTVSNDSWFGDSIGPLQHLQMAQFRALETGRPMLRGTNNGVSAIIDHRGRIKAQEPQFEERVISGELQPRTGWTPVVRTGSWPTLVLCAALLSLFLALQGRQSLRSNSHH